MADEIKVTLSADDNASRVLDQYERKVKDAGRSSEDMGLSLGKLGAAFGVAQIGAGALTGTVTTLASGAFQLSQEFDNAGDSIRIMTGATGAQLEQLQATATSTLGTVTQGIGEITAAQNQLTVRLGLTGDALQATNQQYLDFARITGVDSAQSVRTLTRFMGDWGIAADDANATMDKLLRTQQLSGQVWTDTAQQAVFYGTTLRSLGLSADEALGMLAKWEREGVNVETVLGGMRIATVRLSEANVDVAQTWREAVNDITNASSDLEASRIAASLVGQRAATDFAKAVREGRLQIDEDTGKIVASLGGVSEASIAVRGSAEQLAEAWGLVLGKFEPSVSAIEANAAALLNTLLPAIDKVASPDVLGRLPQLAAFLASPIGAGGQIAAGVVGGMLGGTQQAEAATEALNEANEELAETLTSEVVPAQAEASRSAAEWKALMDGTTESTKRASGAMLAFGKDVMRDAMQQATAALREMEREAARVFKNSVEGRVQAMQEAAANAGLQRQAEQVFEDMAIAQAGAWGDALMAALQGPEGAKVQQALRAGIAAWEIDAVQRAHAAGEAAGSALGTGMAFTIQAAEPVVEQSAARMANSVVAASGRAMQAIAALTAAGIGGFGESLNPLQKPPMGWGASPTYTGQPVQRDPATGAPILGGQRGGGGGTLGSLTLGGTLGSLVGWPEEPEYITGGFPPGSGGIIGGGTGVGYWQPNPRWRPPVRGPGLWGGRPPIDFLEDVYGSGYAVPGGGSLFDPGTLSSGGAAGFYAGGAGSVAVPTRGGAYDVYGGRSVPVATGGRLGAAAGSGLAAWGGVNVNVNVIGQLSPGDQRMIASQTAEAMSREMQSRGLR